MVCGREEGWEGEEMVVGLIVRWRAGDGSWGGRWLEYERHDGRGGRR